jgi:hypothetical protein
MDFCPQLLQLFFLAGTQLVLTRPAGQVLFPPCQQVGIDVQIEGCLRDAVAFLSYQLYGFFLVLSGISSSRLLGHFLPRLW